MFNLDVTLRDGGYRNNFGFTTQQVVSHARASVAAGFDWVEVAYRGGSANGPSGLGPTGRGENSLIRAAAEAVGPQSVGLIAHPRNLTERDLVESFDAGARLLRLCLAGHPRLTDFEWLARARATGFTVSANLVRVSELSIREVVSTAAAAVDAGASVVYLADSNGALRPSDVRRLVTSVEGATSAAVGFHAHDNLGLAMANALAAVESGATWIDSSIRGMGKGPGNLRAEQWLASTADNDVDLEALMELVHAVDTAWPEATLTSPLPDLLLGIFNLPVDARAQLSGSDARLWVAAARNAATAR